MKMGKIKEFWEEYGYGFILWLIPTTIFFILGLIVNNYSTLRVWLYCTPFSFLMILLIRLAYKNDIKIKKRFKFRK